MTSHLFLACFMSAFLCLAIYGQAAKAGAPIAGRLIAGCSWAGLSLLPLVLIGHALPARLLGQRIGLADIGVVLFFVPLAVLASNVPLLMVPRRWRG